MNASMSLSQRADALEAKMAKELDYIVIKSRLYSMAEGDMGPPPNASALMKQHPNAHVLMGDDPRLPALVKREFVASRPGARKIDRMPKGRANHSGEKLNISDRLRV